MVVVGCVAITVESICANRIAIIQTRRGRVWVVSNELTIVESLHLVVAALSSVDLTIFVSRETSEAVYQADEKRHAFRLRRLAKHLAALDAARRVALYLSWTGLREIDITPIIANRSRKRVDFLIAAQRHTRDGNYEANVFSKQVSALSKHLPIIAKNPTRAVKKIRLLRLINSHNTTGDVVAVDRADSVPEKNKGL